MKRKAFFLVALIFIVLSTGFLSCSSQSKEQLILGEWQFQEPKYDKTGYDKNEVFVFFRNNIFWHGYKSGDEVAQKVIGDYTIKDNGKFLEITLAPDFGGSKDSTEIIELTDQTLILKPKIGTENLVLKKTKVFTK